MILNPYAVVIDAYATLVGKKPGASSYADHKAYINANGQNAYYAALETIFATTSNASMATTVLANLGLSSVFTQAQGEAYFASNAGARVSAALNLASLLANYAGTDAAIVAAKTAYNNTTANAYEYASNSANTADAASTSTAVSTGQTFTLTDKTDVATGSGADDTFIGEASTSSSADQLVGGDGTDTFKLYDAAAQSDIAATSSIEIIELIKPVADLDLSNTSATTIIADDLTTAKTITVNAGQSVTLKNLAGGETQDITTTAADTTADVVMTAVGTKATAHTLVDINGAAVATINLTSTGTANFLTGLTADAALTTLNISGDADLSITTTFATATAINITNSAKTTITTDVAKAVVTGGAGVDFVTMEHKDASEEFSVSLAGGDDKVTLEADALADLTDNKVTISGGDGTDTLAVTSAFGALISAATDAALAKKGIANDFEAVEINDQAAAADALNVTKFGTGITKVDYSAGLGDAQTMTNLASGSTIVLGAAGSAATDGLTVTVKDASAAGSNSDVLNITLDGAHAGATLVYGVVTAAAVETVNINSTSTKTTALVAADKNDLDGIFAGAKTINVSGNVYAILVNDPFDATGLETVNASANTAGVEISVAGAGQGVVVTGTAKADALTGSSNADQITGGAGKDTITGGAGNDVINTGADSDTIVFEGTAANNGKDTVSDFTAGAVASGGDVLDFGTNALGTTAATTATLALTAGSANQAIADDTVYQMALGIDIAAKDFGGADFADLFGAGAGKFSTTVVTGIDAFVLVKGNDVTHVYQIDEGGDVAIAAGEVTLVAVLTVAGDMVAANFA